MIVLALNCGSSSVKYKLFEMPEGKTLARGLVERIGMTSSRILHNAAGKDEFVIEQLIQNHQKAVEGIIEMLTHPEHGVLYSVLQIDLVGHRVVHGGEHFRQPVLINEEVMEFLEGCSEMAPLHNPPNLAGIKVCLDLMSGIKQAAVFDTAFHQTMPQHAYIYALPYRYYEEYRLRKYGFHGTSHNYVSRRAAEILGKDRRELKIVTCHLGNGSSLCAVCEGKSVDTTMGFTPTAGLVMGTRCGDVDPAIIPMLTERENLDYRQFSDLLNKQSGVLGISGLSSDFRDLERYAGEGHKQARLALDIFVYSVIKGIGALTAAMGGLDVLVFTAGIGENSPGIRNLICSKLSHLGVTLDKDRNNIRGKDQVISSNQFGVKVLVIPTDEEMIIAKETFDLCYKYPQD